MTFKVGDTVEWTSCGKTKRGEVVAIVPAHIDPLSAYDQFWAGTYDTSACSYGGSRYQESYVIAVSGNGRPKLYWPRVCQLRKVRK